MSTDKFSLIIGVYDSTGSILEENRGPYTIAISLSNSGVFSGVTLLDTSQGIAYFEDMRILSNGNFIINGVCENATQAISSTLHITNAVYSIEALCYNSSVTAGFFFNITVAIKGEDLKLYTNIALIELSEVSNTPIYGTNSMNTTTGIAIFQIYLNNIDSKTIIISCNNITTYIGIEILQIINTDPKCFTALNSSYCKQCISNTYILNGICSCIENSQYSDITKTCECNNGLSLINGYCIGCENYYQNSELSGIFSNDFKSIIITFARQAVINYQDSCKTLLILPNYLLILSPTCI